MKERTWFVLRFQKYYYSDLEQWDLKALEDLRLEIMETQQSIKTFLKEGEFTSYGGDDPKTIRKFQSARFNQAMLATAIEKVSAIRKAKMKEENAKYHAIHQRQHKEFAECFVVSASRILPEEKFEEIASAARSLHDTMERSA